MIFASNGYYSQNADNIKKNNFFEDLSTKLKALESKSSNSTSVFDGNMKKSSFNTSSALIENFSKNNLKINDSQLSLYDDDLDDINGYYDNTPATGEKDGKIAATEQQTNGDCWLLAGINALNATEDGKKIIQNALEYRDGSTVVHFPAFGDVEISDEALANAKNGSQYAKGDDDMIIFELAVENVLDNIANGNIVLGSDAPSCMENAEELRDDLRNGKSINGGYVNELIYMLTGKAGETINDSGEIQNILSQFEQNGNNGMAIGAHTEGNTTIQDVNGKNIDIQGLHSYSVKSVENGVVTILNPWNSGEEIKLDINTFTNTFGTMEVTDLNGNDVDASVSYNENSGENKISGDVKENSDKRKMVKTSDADKMQRVEVKHDKNGTEMRIEYNYERNSGKLLDTEVSDGNGRILEQTTYKYDEITGRLSSKEVKNFAKFNKDEYGKYNIPV